MYTTNKQLPALLKQMHNVKGADPEISERGGGGGGREKLFVAHDYGALNIACVGRGKEDHTSPKIVEKRFVNS